MSYEGPERRRHRVYVTRNTEYHLRDGVCVAVRDRASRRFRPGHIAVDLRLEGGVKIYANGACVPNVADPAPGDAILFTVRDDRQIVTSRIESIERPSKRDVAAYPRGRSAAAR
jgi:hypothetical protein